MQTVDIFRIQGEDGNGPYSNHDLLFGLLRKHGNADGIHPNPFVDKGIGRYPNYDREFCGFKSLDDLLKWFNSKELREMAKLGYVITVVKGRVTAVGEKQILFEKVAV